MARPFAQFSSLLMALDARAETRPTLWRWILAGPMAFVLAVLNMAALPLLVPVGAGGINHLLLPVLFFPLIWSAYCVWPVATERLGRCAFWFCVATILCVMVLVFQFLR